NGHKNSGDKDFGRPARVELALGGGHSASGKPGTTVMGGVIFGEAEAEVVKRGLVFVVSVAIDSAKPGRGTSTPEQPTHRAHRVRVSYRSRVGRKSPSRFPSGRSFDRRLQGYD